MSYVLRFTAWGRHIYATGDDPEASRLTGIKVDRVLVSVYAVAGLHLRHRRLVPHGRIGAASPQSRPRPTSTPSRPWSSAAPACSAGVACVIGTLLGAIIVGMARNGLSLAGFDPLWQDFTIGVLVIVAVTRRPVDPEGERMTAVVTEAIPTPSSRPSA